MSKDTPSAVAYPTVEQYEAWKRRAKALDMSISGYMNAMIEAGHKKFDASVTPDVENDTLRTRVADLRDELERERERSAFLEDRLHDTQEQVVRDYLEDHPEATYAELLHEVEESAGGRLRRLLERLEGETVARDGDQFRLIEERDE